MSRNNSWEAYKQTPSTADLSSSQSSNGGMGWRALAGTAAHRAKEYVATKEYKNTYDNISNRVSEGLARRLTNVDVEDQPRSSSGLGQWARQRMSRSTTDGNGKEPVGIENLQLFPGWAVRRYKKGEENLENAPFDIDVYVSGFASSIRPPEYTTRSQRVFMQLAKRYAALPKLPIADEIEKFTSNQTASETHLPLSKSMEDLLKSHPLPPTPSEMTEDKEMAILEAHFRKAEEDNDTESDSRSLMSNDSPPPSPTLSSVPTQPARPSDMSIEELKKLHANLNSRLELFWASILSNRTIKLSIFASPPPPSNHSKASKESLLIDLSDEKTTEKSEIDLQPLAIGETTTTAQGDFQKCLRIKWDTLCTDPAALHIAFGDRLPSNEYTIFLRAQLVPLPTLQPTGSATNLQHVQDNMSHISANNAITTETTASVKLTHAEIRLISDIDDTVKMSNILSGAKNIFHNIFVSELEKLVIHNMSEWYKRLWNRGVRFHYVSNSPFQLLPVINQFIRLSELPDGSVKLRSYTGKSLFNGLLSSPSVRKRHNVIEVLNDFPECRFLLVGDSGEQDLELYAAIAKERPHQIMAVFIRDVSTLEEEPLTDPTGAKWQQGICDDVMQLFHNPHAYRQSSNPEPPHRSNSQSSSQNVAYQPYRRQNSISSLSSFTSAVLKTPTEGVSISHNGLTSEPESMRRPDFPGMMPRTPTQTDANVNLQSLPLAMRRRVELQMRVNRAREEAPPSVYLRVFKDALECTEVEELLHRHHH